MWQGLSRKRAFAQRKPELPTLREVDGECVGREEKRRISLHQIRGLNSGHLRPRPIAFFLVSTTGSVSFPLSVDIVRHPLEGHQSSCWCFSIPVIPFNTRLPACQRYSPTRACVTPRAFRLHPLFGPPFAPLSGYTIGKTSDIMRIDLTYRSIYDIINF